jgi:hypothetical protein
MNKYEKLPFKYFGFEVFEEILKAINKRTDSTHDPMFNNGVGSAEAAVRRVREEYYEAIKQSHEGQD